MSDGEPEIVGKLRAQYRALIDELLNPTSKALEQYGKYIEKGRKNNAQIYERANLEDKRIVNIRPGQTRLLVELTTQIDYLLDLQTAVANLLSSTVDDVKAISYSIFDTAAGMVGGYSERQQRSLEDKLRRVEDSAKKKRKVELKVEKNVEKELKVWLAEREAAKKAMERYLK